MGLSTLVRAVSALSVTQMLGWGTTFYLPAVFAPAIAAGTRLPVELVFGGVTLMLAASAVIAPICGRGFARWGTRPFMTGGSVLIALGLWLMGRAEGPLLFAAAWILIGIAMPAALGQAAQAAIVQIAPDRARGAITVLLLFSGMTSTASWPILMWLDVHLGWRDSLSVFAALHLLVAAPLHWIALPTLDTRPRLRDPAAVPPLSGARIAPQVPIRGGFALVATAFALIGFVTWGVPLQLILLIRGVGLPEATAILIGAMFGPSQGLARLFELVGGHRVPIMTTGLLAVGLVPVSLLVLFLAGATPAGALAFVLIYGFAAGLASVARAMVPLKLFGASAYAVVAGRLALPQNLAFGLAPLCLAAIREHLGTNALILAVLAVSIASLATMILLAWRVRGAERARALPDQPATENRSA